MAELGDIRRFPHRSSIVAFAGVDPGVVGSGKMQLSSVATSKRGSPSIEKSTLSSGFYLRQTQTQKRGGLPVLRQKA